MTDSPLPVDGPDLAGAIALANIPTLLPLLVQVTGDRRWLDEHYRPTRPVGMDDNDSGGLPDDVQEEIRAAALEAIEALRSGHPPAEPEPDAALLLELLSHSMSEPIPPEYGPMLVARFHDPAPAPSLPVPEGFRVLVVGAGFSGIIIGHRLAKVGVPFTILEKNDGVGGTWHDNRYPGAGVDTPSHLYTLSFAPHDWTSWFSLQPQVREYLEHTASELDLRSHIRLGTAVTAAHFDVDRRCWSVEVSHPDGTTGSLEADVLISAVGIFNPPKTPDIPGLDTFEGECAHSARWPDDLDLRGKRVTVVGSGASAMQIVPAIADEVEQLTIFQRSPQWVLPFGKFHQDVPAPIRALMRDVPLYRKWYAARLAWTFNDQLHPVLQIDPEWPHPDRSINRSNDRHRVFMTDYIRRELGEKADELLPKVLPTYPPYGKRILLDNGWFRTLRRDHVELVTEGVAAVRADRVIADSGAEYPTDVLVLATGFDVSRFLTAFDIHGRDGRRLSDVWGDDGRAYLGTAVPGLPNFFAMYGPNLQPGHGGSILFTLERQANYILDVLRQMFEHDLATVEVRPVVAERYNLATDARLDRMVWTHPGMQTYYRNTKGRIVVNSPYRHSEWYTMTESAELDDFDVEPRSGERRSS